MEYFDIILPYSYVLISGESRITKAAELETLASAELYLGSGLGGRAPVGSGPISEFPPIEGAGTQSAQNDRRRNSVPPRSALL